MKDLLSLLVLGFSLLTFSAEADETTVQFRVTGLFQPDRIEDLRRQAGELRSDKEGPVEVRLVDVNYDSTLVTFGYDPASKMFKGAKPDQVRERINTLLRNVSHGTFEIFPPDPRIPTQLQEQRIPVAGLDCKGCAYGAYRAIAKIDGVQRAIVSFKEGHLNAWIDPAQTNRQALIDALEKAHVQIVKPVATSDTKPAKP